MGVHFTFKNQAVMKFFLAIFVVLAVANAQESCDLCKMGVDALGQYLMTEAEIAAVEEGLVDLVCSTLDEEQIQTCAEESTPGGHQLLKLSLTMREPLLQSVLEPE